MTVKQHHDIVSLDKILSIYARGYNPESGKVINRKWYVDIHEYKVVFVLTIDEGEEDEVNG